MSNGVTASADTRVAIQELLERYADRRRAGDVEGMVDLFTPGASVMVPGAPVLTGRDALLQAYEGFRSTPGLECAYVFDEILASGDLATARTHSTGTYFNHDEGKAAPASWREVFAFGREGGDWKIALYMFQGVG
jgi:uncharacterized protein (TIGR02246 family)